MNAPLEEIKHTAYIGIGSNLGDRAENISAATALLRENPMVSISRISNIYETDPVTTDGGPQPMYLNGAIEIETTLAPRALLDVLIGIEAELGRLSPRAKGTPRTIDLDILFYDDLIMDEPDLKIPHPEVSKRMFVLLPLCDIAPLVVHPAEGRSIRAAKEALERKPG